MPVSIVTEEGRRAWQSIVANPGGTLLCSDFDGVLSPIVLNPDEAYADPATIDSEVARLVKEAMEQALKTEAAEAAKRGEPAKPMIIDISV